MGLVPKLTILPRSMRYSAVLVDRLLAMIQSEKAKVRLSSVSEVGIVGTNLLIAKGYGGGAELSATNCH